MENRQSRNRSLTFSHRGNIYLIGDFPKKEAKLKLIETLVIDVRGDEDSVSFSEMDADERQLAWDNILFYGTACTGCQVPTTDILASRIASQISNYIFSFGYKDYTEREIELAMQLNAHNNFDELGALDLKVVEFTGIYFNLNYFASVLGNYKKIRDHIDRKFQNFLDGYSK